MTCKNFLLFKKGSSLLLTHFSCVNSSAVSWPVPSRLRPGWPVAPRQAARAPRSGAGARTLPSALRSGPSSRDAIPAPPGPPGTRRPAGQGAGPGAASRGRAGYRGSDTPAPGWSQLVRTACRPAATQPSPWPSRARPETSPQFKTEGPVRQAPFQGVGECGCPRHASQGAVPAPQGSARGARPPPAGVAAPPRRLSGVSWTGTDPVVVLRLFRTHTKVWHTVCLQT